MTPPWTAAVVANGFAIIVLLTLLLDFHGKQRCFLLRDQVIFQWMLILNIVILVLDAGTYVLNGQTFAGARVLNLLITTAFFILNPLMSVLYALFCDVRLKTSARTRNRLVWLYWLPFAVNLVFALLSVRYSLLFRLDANNMYNRGSMFGVSFALSFVLLGVSFVRILVYHRRYLSANEPDTFASNRHTITLLLLFPAVPLLGGVLQSCWFTTVTVVWLSTVIALLILFINTQNAEIFTDSLTGLYNRKKANCYMQSFSQTNGVYMAVLDVDNFKRINDCFGHLTGDKALKIVADTLQAVCDRDTFLSRYGGDEFMLISRQGGKKKLEGMLKRVEKNLLDYCSVNKLSYSLSISAGIAEGDESTESIDALFSAADTQLYRSKTKLKRRADDLQ
jgi:diguanylate cyclase (GGDEF)-like protein